MPHVVRVQWEPDDHLAELCHMLQGAAAENVESQLVQYVENKIEPTGWKAVWTVPPNLPNSSFNLKQEACVYVDVIDVSREKLTAAVKVLKPVGNMLKGDLHLIEEAKNKVFQVPLIELSVLADQENGALDMVNTAEVICQIKFFYEHIWQPWDLEEENTTFTHAVVTSRLKLYQDIQDGLVPSSVAAHLKAIIREACATLKELQNIESRNEAKGLDFEMDEKDVAHLFKLHKQLENLKAQFELLKNPILRELSIFPTQEEEMHVKKPYSKVKIVAHGLTTSQMLKQMAMLPELIKSLTQITDEDLWQTCSTLQDAIHAAHEGDVIILLPGQHTLCQLGFLFAKCGTLIGLGEGVVVEGKSENGDVLMDITGNFTIQNIVLKPGPGQIGVVVHNGLTIMQEVTIMGGKWGVLGLKETQMDMNQVSVQNCSSGGIDFRDGAAASISSSTIKNCRIGIQFEEGAKVSLSSTRVEHNEKYGMVKLLPEGKECSAQETPAEAKLACLLQNDTENTVEQNGENVAVLSAALISPKS